MFCAVVYRINAYKSPDFLVVLGQATSQLPIHENEMRDDKRCQKILTF